MLSDKRNWQVVYSSYVGCEKKAVELISREISALISRDAGKYTIHTLACVTPDAANKDKNMVVIGRHEDNSIIQKYVAKDEIPEDGYVIKVMNNPENPELKIAILTALNPREVFYAAVDFVDFYFPETAPMRSNINYHDEIFDFKLKDYCMASAPAVKNRNIFTWAHPICDWRGYIDNAARLKFNELILWNDYAPINAKEIVEYAHEYGISIIWGFAWGWSRNCKDVDFKNLGELTQNIIEKYETEYMNTGADGIYFQSFTEMEDEYIGDKLVAQVVTDFVNDAADKLLAKHPGLLLQFGLHATSVNNRLDYIKNVDSRVDIIWEDCGAFPYSYSPNMNTREEYDAALKFTEKMMTLRKNSHDGVLYKGNLTLDWEGDHFVHQTGPYIMGMEAKKTVENDLCLERAMWKDFQANWIINGKYAYEMTEKIAKCGNEKTSVGVAGNLANGIWFPAALLSQILWDCGKPYEEILEKTLRRRCVDMV